MRFAHPEWLLCLIALPILALVALLARKQRGERWKKLVAARLQHRLSNTRSAWVHLASLALALFGLAGLILAFAQPESGEEWIEVENEGRNILFCIDISRSMLAEDIQPNRLQASRAAALEILERFPNDRVGVLLFAGENLMQSPLTLDHSFVEQTLAQLDPADIPYGGSNLGGAIDDGVRLLTKTGQQSNIMVVFSDGENSTSGVEASIANAAKEGIFIYALGMGTREGSFIPDPRQRDGKFRDRSGNPVFTQLNEEELQMTASKTEGFYSRGIGGTFLNKLDSALEEMDRFREEGKHQRVAKPAHQWFLFGGLLLLMLSIFVRALPLRPAIAALACFFSFPHAEASLISDGREALERGDQLEAHQFFRLAAKEESGERAARLQLAAGSAAHRAKSWHAAADCFSEALESDVSETQQKAHYALATSLFYLGVPLEGEAQMKAWKGSVKHYQAALEIAPNDEQAIRNLKQVQEFLLQKQQEQKEEDKQDSEKEDQEDKESEEDKKEDGENQDNKEQGEKDENDQQDQSDENQEQQEQEGENGEDEPSEEGQNQKQADEPKPSDQEGKEGQNEPEPGEGGEQEGENSEQSGDQKGDKAPGEQKENPQEAKEMKPGEEPQNESREERARRLLKQYADFGGKAPRNMKRPYNRAAQDW